MLVIEDLAEMRATMKSMLASMGVQSIETVNNGEEALAKLAFNRYDIIFSDYELGRGKDGQQILEEVRHSNLIAASTVYILVTAAQTMEMVMGALEYEPDGYITKPVTLEILRTRLNRIIRTKDTYQDINQAIDRQDINAALEACNRLAMENPKFALSAYRIKGKLLLGENRIEEARDLYDTVLGIKRVAWAMLGMGKILYLQKQYDEAQKLLGALANTKAQYVEAFDWLAKVLEAQGKFKAAQRVLEQAIATSPKSVLRQQELARLAELNGDNEAMYKACRKAHALAKNSVFRNPDILIRYAKSLQPTIKQGDRRDQKIAHSEALSLLEQVKTEFQPSLLQNWKCTLLEAQTHAGNGNLEAAKLSFLAAQALQNEIGKLSLDDQLDLFAAQLQIEEESTAMTTGETLLGSIGKDLRLQSKYYRILENHLLKRTEERRALLNKRGKELLDLNDPEEAFTLLSRSCQLDATDIDSQLLALRAAVTLHSQSQLNSDNRIRAEELFKGLEKFDHNDPRYPALEKLRLQWAEPAPHA